MGLPYYCFQVANANKAWVLLETSIKTYKENQKWIQEK